MITSSEVVIYEFPDYTFKRPEETQTKSKEAMYTIETLEHGVVMNFQRDFVFLRNTRFLNNDSTDRCVALDSNGNPCFNTSFNERCQFHSSYSKFPKASNHIETELPPSILYLFFGLPDNVDSETGSSFPKKIENYPIENNTYTGYLCEIISDMSVPIKTTLPNFTIEGFFLLKSPSRNANILLKYPN